MQRAWQQVQKVYEANRKIRNVSVHDAGELHAINAQFFATLPPAKLLAVTTPVHAKVLGSPTTIRQQLLESRLGLRCSAPRSVGCRDRPASWRSA